MKYPPDSLIQGFFVKAFHITGRSSIAAFKLPANCEQSGDSMWKPTHSLLQRISCLFCQKITTTTSSSGQEITALKWAVGYQDKLSVICAVISPCDTYPACPKCFVGTDWTCWRGCRGVQGLFHVPSCSDTSHSPGGLHECEQYGPLLCDVPFANRNAA